MTRTPAHPAILAVALAALTVSACASTPGGNATATPTAPSAPPAVSQSANADLDIRFTGIDQHRGAIMVALFNSQDAYDNNGRPVASARIEVTGPEAIARFPGLAPGEYGVKAFHDVNGDGQMNTNPFGIPSEPFAFSNGAVAMMGPPKWAAAAFAVPAGASVQTIAID